MRSSRFLLAALSISTFLFISQAHASLSISPLKFEYSVDPGQTVSDTVRVTNNADTPVTLYSAQEDFIAGDESGTPKFVALSEQTSEEYSMAKWISLENANITLGKGESRDVRFTVKIPKTAEPGGHYGAIFFSPGVQGKSQVTIIQRIGALILVNVKGDVKIAGSLEKFSVGQREWSGTTRLVEKDVFDNFPVSFHIAFNNEWSTHLKPTGKIELIDENNEVLKGIGKEMLASEQGAYIGEKIVDYLPVNSEWGNVLPKSKRVYEVNWEGFGYSQLNEIDGKKEVKFKGLTEYYANKAADSAKYLQFWESIHTRNVRKQLTANLTLSFEGKDRVKQDFRETKKITVVYDEQYVGMNYTIILVLILIIGGALYYVLVQAPKNKARIREELLKEMNRS